MDILSHPEKRTGTPFTPAGEITDLAAGATETLELEGYRNREYGVTQILGWSTSPSDVVVEITHNEGRDPWINTPGVSLPVLNRLFAQYELDVPLVIDRKKKVEITVENRGSSALDVAFSLPGLTYRNLDKRRKAVKQQNGGMVPKPRFIYAREEIPAGKNLHQVNLISDPPKLQFDRILAASQSEDDIKLRLREEGVTIMPMMRLALVNKQFEEGDSSVLAFTKSAESDFNAEVTNTDTTTAHEVSLLAAAYRADKIQQGI